MQTNQFVQRRHINCDCKSRQPYSLMTFGNRVENFDLSTKLCKIPGTTDLQSNRESM